MPQNESLEHTVWMDKQYFLIVKAKNTFDFLQIAFFCQPFLKYQNDLTGMSFSFEKNIPLFGSRWNELCRGVEWDKCLQIMIPWLSGLNPDYYLVM